MISVSSDLLTIDIYFIMIRWTHWALYVLFDMDWGTEWNIYVLTDANW